MQVAPTLLMRTAAASVALLLVTLDADPTLGQTTLAPAIQPPAGPTSTEGRTAPGVPSREVLVDVVALDQQNHPVPDMQQADFQIFELAKRAQIPREITAFLTVDPTSQLTSSSVAPVTASSAHPATPGESCATHSSLHYRLAFRADYSSWPPGFHNILVTTSRPGVHLSFRNNYPGIPVAPKVGPQQHIVMDEDEALELATCKFPITPPSLSLSASLIQTVNDDRLRYSLLVPPDSLQFAPLAGERREVSLDYGICTFDARGHSRYAHASIERSLSYDQFQQAAAQGFRYELEIDRKGSPVLARFVVRDRETGNIGSTEAVIAPPTPPDANTLTSAAPPQNSKPGLFGSVVPRPNTLCGKVYDLAPGATFTGMPVFNAIDLIGQIYATTLNVPLQIPHPGVLGVTAATEWFGIDYSGEFWVNTPGDYSFMLIADEGAQLFIDDQLVIDLSAMSHLTKTTERPIPLAAGRHTLYLPYAQAITHVELILEVKPPGGDFRPFDLHDFPPNYRVNSKVLPGFEVLPTQP